MIAEIGQFALVLALIIALLQSTLPLIGAQRGNATLMMIARPAAQSLFLLVGVAYAALTYAFVVSDFSVATVLNNSHSLKPMLYKVTGVWANHEGSMLLWVLILALFGAAVAQFGINLPLSLKARALAVQGMIATAFLAFLIFTSNPFLRIDPVPIDGRGLNPLLQDPGLAFHPPLLYLGYVGFSIAFSFAVAALIEGRVDAAWGRWVRPWTLAAWTFLTGGIALGSWWAYYELGWGGWWFWDPVENASFMPWLLGTALLHSAIVVEKRDTLKSWTILLAILTFSLSLLGTFIVRSGVLTSVHAFATDPTRGLFILGILILAIGGSLALFALRAPVLKANGVYSPVSREGGLILNNLLLAVACATVLLGTLYPLLLEALTDGRDKVSVGPPFFNGTFVPIMVPLFLVMAIGPYLAWKRGNLRSVARRMIVAAIGAVAAIIVTFLVVPDGPALTPFAMGLATWLLLGAASEWADRIKLFRAPLSESWRRLQGLPRAATGMTLAHMGIAVMIMGVAGSSSWQTEAIQVLAPGQSVQVASYEFRLDGVEEGTGPNYTLQRATVTVSRNGRVFTVLYPEQRFFPVAGQSTTEAAIRTTPFADLYAVIGEPDGNGGWTTRFYRNPLVPWIWYGALIMVAGGLLSLTDRRHRVGAPKRAALKSAPAVSHAAAAE
ncbi:MAG: heme lyase CcmF/NrfE family subunit [Alphaproteobacteria bacterium]